MKVHKITLLVVDFDQLGSKEITAVLENENYPNHCMYPSVLNVETKDVEWSDSHPLNNSRTKRAAAEELFGK
jgi:hypothetical protein